MRRIFPALPLVTLTLLLGCRDFGNPSDPGASGYTVRSETFLKRLGDREPVAGDTVRLLGGITSAPVEGAGLVVRYAWDLDGDGRIDTTVAGTDSFSLPARESGAHKVALVLTDKAGFTSEAGLDFQVHPRLSALFSQTGYDSGCPAYAQEPLLMRMALALSHFTLERTKAEGLSATDLALDVARALTGSAFPIGLLDGFDYSFSHGVYHFRNHGFTLDAAFHYGPGSAGHAEGDTIRSDLFSLDSYVTDISTTLLPPAVAYSRGPLADLINGDINVDSDDIRHPKFDFRIDFNRIRFSFSRTTRSLFVLSNEEITLANALFFTLYEGRARMAPLYLPDLIRLYGHDSLELDFSGTRVSSPELPLAWTYAENGVQDTAVYRLSLVQETVQQDYRFGDEGGVKKVFGTYAAVNRLGAAGDPLEAVYFQGGYSTIAADSARFFCGEAMKADQFYGAAAFETDTAGRGSFASQRYGYAFGFPFSTAQPWAGGVTGVPDAVQRAVGGP